MGRALLVLESNFDRRKAVDWIGKAPVGTRVEFKASKRTLPQNDMLWALLTEIAQQLGHAGKKYDPSQWKAIFLHAFGREVSFLPSLDQKTFLPIELSSSDLSKDEMTDFIEFIMKEAAERGVVFKDHRNQETTESGSSVPSREPVTAEEVPNASAASDDAAPSVSSDAPTKDQSALFPMDRADLIECCKKLMSIPVDKTLATPEAKRGVLVAAKDNWKVKLPAELHDHIKAFFESADAQIKAPANDFQRLRSSALEQFAEMLECSVEEIGGNNG